MDTVYIPQNQSILLDISPPPLKIIIIEGTLIIEDENDITLQSEYIIIRGGSLKAGSLQTPFAHKLTILLQGKSDSIQLPIFGNKVLAVFDGEIQLIGKTKQWLKASLNKTALNSETKVFSF